LEQQREIEKLMKDIKKGEKKRKEQEEELAKLRAEHQQQQQQHQAPLDSARSMMSSVMPDTSRTSASSYRSRSLLPFDLFQTPVIVMIFARNSNLRPSLSELRRERRRAGKQKRICR
jgi:hypothetical protein